MKFCWQCGNKVGSDDKYCQKCGQSQIKGDEPSSISEHPPGIKLPEEEISKLEKKITSTGSNTVGLGWINIILNGAMLFFPNYSVMSFSIISIASIVIIILGNRIKSIDVYTKKNLIALIVSWLFIVVYVLATGGKIGIIGILVSIYILDSYSSINKLYKALGYQEKLKKPKYKIGVIQWVLYVFLGIIVIISSLYLDYIKVGPTTYWNNFVTSCATGAGGDQYKLTCECAAKELQAQNSYTEAIWWDVQMRLTKSVPATLESAITKCSQQSSIGSSSIEQFVTSVKEQYKLPYRLDDVTTMIDVTAESNAIRYHYILSGSSMNNLTNDSIKNTLIKGICENKDTKALLDSGVNMEYSYSVSGSNNKYFVTFSKNDCSY